MQALRAPFPDLNSTSGSSDYSFTIDAALNASLRSQTPMHHDQSVDEPMNQAFGEMGFNSTNVRGNSDPRSVSQHALGLGLPPQVAAPDRPASSSSVSRTVSTSSFNPASQDPFYAGVLPPQINFPSQASTSNIDPLWTVRNAQLVNHARQQAAQFRPHPPTVQPQYARATNLGPSASSAQVRFDPAYTVPPSFPGFDYSSGPACSAAPFMPPNSAHNNNTNSSEEEWAWSARPSGKPDLVLVGHKLIRVRNSDQGATNLIPEDNNRNLQYNNSSGSGSHFNNIFCNSNAYDTSYGPQQPQPQPPQGQSFMDPATVAMTQQTFDHISPLIPPGFW